MKNLLFSLILLTLCFSSSAQTVDPSSQKLIDTFVKSNIEFQLEEIDQTSVAKVFSGKFFRILVGFVETGTGATYCGSDNYINVDGSAVNMIEPIHMDLECPVLLSLIKKDFLLKDENAAQLFEAALNVLYPVDEDELPDVKHLKEGSQWIFLRGKFFDDYKAFIATTDPDGKITKVELILSYSVN
ncbi:MAG: hypothetical protein ACOYXB_11415 [Bacteroidota bacterium]